MAKKKIKMKEAPARASRKPQEAPAFKPWTEPVPKAAKATMRVEVKAPPKPAEVDAEPKIVVAISSPDRLVLNYEGGVPLLNSTVPGILEITIMRKVPS